MAAAKGRRPAESFLLTRPQTREHLIRCTRCLSTERLFPTITCRTSAVPALLEAVFRKIYVIAKTPDPKLYCSQVEAQLGLCDMNCFAAFRDVVLVATSWLFDQLVVGYLFASVWSPTSVTILTFCKRLFPSTQLPLFW